MTALALNNLALKFGLTIFLVQSWWEKNAFQSEQEAEVFFNLSLILGRQLGG